MPLRNRVTPLGELVADPARGLVYGNRGCLHDAHGRIRRALQRQALDRLPARVPRLAPAAASAARPLHRALLPRRGDRVRRRPPAVRALPPRGLQPLRSALARASPGPRRSRRDRRAAPRGAARGDGGDRRLHSAPFDEPARRRVRPRGREARARARTTSFSAGTRRATSSATPRPARRRRRSLITPPSLVAVLRTGWQPVVPLLHPSAF